MRTHGIRVLYKFLQHHFVEAQVGLHTLLFSCSSGAIISAPDLSLHCNMWASPLGGPTSDPDALNVGFGFRDIYIYIYLGILVT